MQIHKYTENEDLEAAMQKGEPMDLFNIFTNDGIAKWKPRNPSLLSEILNFPAKLAESAGNFFKSIAESDLFKGLTDFVHVGNLYSIGYPPCIHLTEEEFSKISELVLGNTKDEAITKEIINNAEKIIFSSYNEEKMNSIYAYWKSFTFLNGGRREALKEAIDAYNDEKYYSCVAIIMCQIEAVINETDQHIRELFEMHPDSAPKKRYYEILDGQKKEFEKLKDNEKKTFREKIPKLVQERLIWSNFNYVALYFSEYFNNYLYANMEDDDNKILNHPIRNKICHGKDINFGTQEKALKSILCMDGLILSIMLALNTIEESAEVGV